MNLFKYPPIVPIDFVRVKISALKLKSEENYFILLEMVVKYF